MDIGKLLVKGEEENTFVGWERKGKAGVGILNVGTLTDNIRNVEGQMVVDFNERMESWEEIGGWEECSKRG